jgi:hypothetical protein
MVRYTFPAFTNAATSRYVVVWDLQWQLIESSPLEPSDDLSGAMSAAIDRLAQEGWKASIIDHAVDTNPSDASKDQ